MFKTNIKEYCNKNNITKKVKYDPSFIVKQIPTFKKELKKIGINIFVIKYTKYNPFEIEEWIDKNLDKIESSDCIYFSEYQVYYAALYNGMININHRVSEDKLAAFNELMINKFPMRTRGIMNERDAIKLYLLEQKYIKVDKPKKQIDLDIVFDNSSIVLDSGKAAKALGVIVKKYGYIDGYDAGAFKGMWNVTLHIDSDKFNNLMKSVKKIKKLDSQKIKSISVEVY